MAAIEIKHLESGIVLATEAQAATNFLARLVGLIGRESLEPGREALILYPCRSVHTFFMRFALDLLYVDREGQVVESVSNLSPRSSGPLVRAAVMVIELPAGVIKEHGVKKGDQLLFNGSKDLLPVLD